MSSFPNLSLGALFAVLVALSSLAGQRVTDVDDSQDFFRWVVTATERHGKDGFIIPRDVLIEIPDLADEKFFSKVNAYMEAELPADVGDSSDTSGTSKLVRLVRTANAEDPIDPRLWQTIRTSGMANMQDEFIEHRRANKLYAAVTGAGIRDLYGDEAVTASLSNVFFGFRRMAANLLWLKTDRYFHSGENHLMVPTIKAVVALDPQFIDAYLIGAWHMAYNMTPKIPPTPEELKEYNTKHNVWMGERERLMYAGIDLLLDGIVANPRNYKLYFDLGYAIYEEKLEDHENAAKYLTEAIRYPHETWVARSRLRVLEYAGRYEEAIEGWKDFPESYPQADAQNVPRFILYSEALIQEREGRSALARAKAAEVEGDTIAAGAARDEWKARFAEARSIWQRINEESGEDPYAVGHLHFMDGIEMFEAGRYYESIAFVEQARRVAAHDFKPMSDYLIMVKQAAGEPLLLTEKMQLMREQDAEKIRSSREAQYQELLAN
jgi:tetratricopeptide (TPR) repeat protein